MHRVYYVCMCVRISIKYICVRTCVHTYIQYGHTCKSKFVCMHVFAYIMYVCMYPFIEIIILWENCPGEYVLLETGGVVSRWNLSGGKVSGGNFPGGICPGRKCPGGSVQGES